jgi:acetyltransferase-like isoleucine patch superfamily enzyme
MKKILDFIAKSEPIQAAITLFIYAGDAVVIGISLMPSIWLFLWAKHVLLTRTAPLPVMAFSVACGCAVFLYFITGAIVMGVTIRLLSLGMKAGRYPMVSFTMLRWLIYSGIYHLAGKTILDLIPLSFLSTMFFRIIGAKIGRNVSINTWYLNDAYLLEIGDNVIIGGKTDISCHTFENGSLLLRHIKIGDGTFIGQRCYISPGVTIGRNCVIGQYSFIRKNKEIPDRSVIASLGGLPIREITRLEKAGRISDDDV